MCIVQIVSRNIVIVLGCCHATCHQCYVLASRGINQHHVWPCHSTCTAEQILTFSITILLYGQHCLGLQALGRGLGQGRRGAASLGACGDMAPPTRTVPYPCPR